MIKIIGRNGREELMKFKNIAEFMKSDHSCLHLEKIVAIVEVDDVNPEGTCKRCGSKISVTQLWCDECDRELLYEKR